MKRFSIIALACAAAMAASTITSCKKGGDDNGGGGEVTKPIPVITITAQPRDIETYDYDIYDSVAVSASVTEGATLTYQWYENTSAGNSGGEKIAGATKSFYHIPEDLTEGTYYYFCEVGAEGAKSVRSRAATVTVLPAPPEPVITIVRHPQSVSFTEGSIEGSLTIEATVTEGKTLDYNWCRSTSPDGIAVSEITGETEASFTIPTDLSAGEYHFLCKVSADGTTPVYSDVATVTVEPVPVPIITIVTQPVRPTGMIIEGGITGYSVALRVEASVSLIDDPDFEYKWYESEKAITVDANQDTYYLPVQTKAGTYSYFCEVSVRMRPDVSTVRTEPVVVEVAKYTPSPGTEVKVGGLVWAGTNVGRTAGTFADNNSTGGLYGGSYQFNRLKGRPVLSSSDPDSWDPSVAPGSPNGWAPSNDPCPPGWRVPSQNEWIALYANVVKSIAVAYTRVWELKDGSKFELPAGGKRNHNDGRTEYMYETGYYWTSSPDQNFSNIRAHYVGIKIDSDKVTLGPDVTGLPYQSGGSVRCVRSAN